MSTSTFVFFKLTDHCLTVQRDECQSQDSTCCAYTNSPACAGCYCLGLPFTFILDLITCGPRYICRDSCVCQELEEEESNDDNG